MRMFVLLRLVCLALALRVLAPKTTKLVRTLPKPHWFCLLCAFCSVQTRLLASACLHAFVVRADKLQIRLAPRAALTAAATGTSWYEHTSPLIDLRCVVQHQLETASGICWHKKDRKENAFPFTSDTNQSEEERSISAYSVYSALTMSDKFDSVSWEDCNTLSNETRNQYWM